MKKRRTAEKRNTILIEFNCLPSAKSTSNIILYSVNDLSNLKRFQFAKTIILADHRYKLNSFSPIGYIIFISMYKNPLHFPLIVKL